MSARLDPDLLLRAYTQGYFPMPDPESDEIVWIRPKKRAIIPLESFHVSRSLSRTLKKDLYKVTFDSAFQEVMRACADRPETWITEEFVDAYSAMFRLGLAHSVETWEGDELVGGLYGVSLGGAFFAESKFHTSTDASKVALAKLVEKLKSAGFILLEVQFMTEHLATLGAKEIPDSQYQQLLKSALNKQVSF